MTIFFFLYFGMFFTFSASDLKEQTLNYLDKNLNGKVDCIEIKFNKNLTGSLQTSKMYIYSNSGGLSTSKLNSVEVGSLLSSWEIQGDTLVLNLLEQDKIGTGFVVNNMTSSHLRIKNNSGVGIVDEEGNEINLSLTTSFDSYKNVFFKEYISVPNPSVETPPVPELPTVAYLGVKSEPYLYKGIQEGQYECREGPCRIDFSIYEDTALTKVFSGAYWCDWEFSHQKFLQTSCTHREVLFDSGVYLGTYKMYDGKTNALLISGNLSVKVLPVSSPASFSGENISSGEILSGSVLVFSGGTTSGGISYQTGTQIFSGEISPSVQTGANVSPFFPRIIFQFPTYLGEKEVIKEKYFCDRTKTDCKVNLNLENASGSLLGMSCKWQFGKLMTGEENSCNPATIIFPEGEHLVEYKVEKNQIVVFSGKFFIQNDGYQEPPAVIKTYYVPSSSSVSQTSTWNASPPKIEVQSGLDAKNVCTSFSCSINVKYEPLSSGEKCRWNFGSGVFLTGALEKCNPSNVRFASGTHTIVLEVYEEGNSTHKKQSQLQFYNPTPNVSVPQESKNMSVFDIPQVNDLEWREFALRNDPSKDSYISFRNVKQSTFSLSGCFLQYENSKETKKWNLEGEISPNAEKKYFLNVMKWSIKTQDVRTFSLYCGNSKIIEQKLNYKYPKNGVFTKGFLHFFDSHFVIQSQHNSGWILQNQEKNQVFFQGKGIDVFENCLFPQDIWSSQNMVEVMLEEDALVGTGLWMGYMTINGQDFGEILLRAGCAKVQTKKNFSHKSTYLEIQNNAKSQKIGNWNQKTLWQNEVKKSLGFSGDIVFEDLSFDKKTVIQKTLQDNFSLKVKKQKKDYILYGTTFPNTRIYFEVKKNETFSFFPRAFAQNDIIEVLSDDEGKYQATLFLEQKGDFQIVPMVEAFEKQAISLDMSLSLHHDGKEGSVQAIISHQKLPKNVSVNANKYICEGSCEINFDGRTSVGENLQFQWDFGNKETSQKNNPSAQKFEVGNYKISLAVHDGNNSSFAYAWVEVHQKSQTSQTLSGSTSKENQKGSNYFGNNSKEPGKIWYFSEFWYVILLFFLFLVLSILILRKNSYI